ncbi:IucA/IucC family C-terminal-domain containing protein [Desmospora activa]|nr:IucA/IucC family C-terminal-domain containing protein [Desmospora activa]
MTSLQLDTASLEKRFAWSFETEAPSNNTFAASLLNPSDRDRLLRMWQERIGTQEWSVAASMLFKRYTALLMPGWLFALSRLDQAITVTPERWALRFGEGWDVSLVLPTEPAVTVPSSADERPLWRQLAVRAFFHDHLAPVIHAFSDHLSPSVCWESARLYLYHYYESWEREAESIQVQKQLQDDLHFLIDRNNPWIDGRTPNPLSIPFRLVKLPEEPDQSMRVRRTCCLYYRLPDAICCTTCPRRKHEWLTDGQPLPSKKEAGGK